MAKINLFTSNLTGKQLISEKSKTKKAVKAALADYEAQVYNGYRLITSMRIGKSLIPVGDSTENWTR